MLFAQSYNAMHICANTIPEERDSKVRQEHQQLPYNVQYSHSYCLHILTHKQDSTNKQENKENQSVQCYMIINDNFGRKARAD